MPASPAAPIATGFAVDEATHTLRFERELDCAPQQAFEAWTKPEEISQWWDPEGTPLATCEIDLRIGGGFTFISRGHPELPFVGSYREIAPPARQVIEAMGAVGRVILESRAARTRMVVEITCANEAHLKQFVQMGVANGTARTLDNLVGHIGKQAKVA